VGSVRAVSRPAHPVGARPGTGYALVLLAVACFVVNAGVARVVLTSGISATDLSALRAVGTATVLLLVVLLSGRRRTLRVHRSEVVPIVAYGVVGVALLHMTYFVAIERLPIGLALLLEYLAPLLVALWVRFVRREQVRATLWPALGLSLTGLALVAQVGGAAGDLDPIGLAAGLGAAICFATYFLVGERLVVHRDPVSTTFWGFVVASVLWSAVVGWWTPLAESAGRTATLPPALGSAVVPLVALVAWVVVLGTLVPFAAATAALRHLPATTVTVVAILEPVGAAVLAWWWFDESLTGLQSAGVALVLSGIVLALRARRTRVPTATTANGPAADAGSDIRPAAPPLPGTSHGGAPHG
jgi:drug/metabolite transporter (DMT)-like permease